MFVRNSARIVGAIVSQFCENTLCLSELMFSQNWEKTGKLPQQNVPTVGKNYGIFWSVLAIHCNVIALYNVHRV